MGQIWKFSRLLAYLDHYGIAVIVKDGRPKLNPPPHMVHGHFLKLLDPILESVQALRIPLLEQFVPYEERPVEPDTIYRDTPAEVVRMILWRRWLNYRQQYGGTLYGYSCYTRDMEKIPDPCKLVEPVRHWSKLILRIDSHQHETRIPNHSPPRITVRTARKVKRHWWKPPKGWKPERDWLRPKGFKVPKPVRSRFNPWSEQLTQQGKMPD